MGLIFKWTDAFGDIVIVYRYEIGTLSYERQIMFSFFRTIDQIVVFR